MHSGGPYWFTAICISCVYRTSFQRLLTPSYKLVFACFDCGSHVANFKVGIMTLQNLQTWSIVNACLLSLPLLKTGWLLSSGCCVSHALMSTKCHSYNLRPPLYVRWITVHYISFLKQNQRYCQVADGYIGYCTQLAMIFHSISPEPRINAVF